MPEPIITASQFRLILDIFLKLKNAFSSLKDNGIFLKETEVSKIVEEYFALEQLPRGDVKLIGKLSNFTLTNNLPAYSPFSSKPEVQVNREPRLNPKTLKIEMFSQIQTNLDILDLPGMAHKNVYLENNSSPAKILWLYTKECNGLILEKSENSIEGRNTQNINKAFKLNDSDRPIPVLVDIDSPISQFLHKTVKVKGRVVSADIQHFEGLVDKLDPFLINYMGNFFRPFSTQGVLAIDLRKPHGDIQLLDQENKQFLMKYTVQGIVEMPKELNLTNSEIYKVCVECIPDRQGIDVPVTAFGFENTTVSAILTEGEIDWQVNIEALIFSAYININVSNANNYQTQIAKLSHHWQTWQKNARAALRKKFYSEPKIYPIMCSNSANEKDFHPNGLQISKELESLILSSNPKIRESIDWLGISTGRK